MRLLFGLATFISFLAVGQPPQIQYVEESASIVVKTKSCMYGRGVEPVLQQQAVDNTRKYALKQKHQIAQQLMRKHQLKKAQTQFIHLLLTSKLTPKSFEFENEFVGNDTCVTGVAKLLVEDQVDFQSLFMMEAPKYFHIETDENRTEQAIVDRLTMYALPIDTNKLQTFSNVLSRFQKDSKRLAYVQFDLNAYLNAVSTEQNTVYVEGTSIFAKILRAYLQDKNFKVVAAPSSAFWRLAINGQIEQEKYVRLNLSVKGKEQNQFVLSNDSRRLPASNLTNPVLLEKFSKVHFELMQLTQALTLK